MHWTDSVFTWTFSCLYTKLFVFFLLLKIVSSFSTLSSSYSYFSTCTSIHIAMKTLSGLSHLLYAESLTHVHCFHSAFDELFSSLTFPICGRLTALISLLTTRNSGRPVLMLARRPQDVAVSDGRDIVFKMSVWPWIIPPCTASCHNHWASFNLYVLCFYQTITLSCILFMQLMRELLHNKNPVLIILLIISIVLIFITILVVVVIIVQECTLLSHCVRKGHKCFT